MRFITVFIRMTRAYLFYPGMIGLFLWLYVKNAHWLYGLAVIIAILVLDPIWRVLGQNILRAIRKKRQANRQK